MTFIEWLNTETPSAKLISHMIAVSDNPEWARTIALNCYQKGFVEGYSEGQHDEARATAERALAYMPVTAGRVQ